MALLTEDGKKQVAAAVAEVERATQGEIVTVVVGRSDDYSSQRLVAAALMSAAVVSGLHSMAPVVGSGWLIVAQLVLWIPAWFLTGVAPVLRMLVSVDTRAAAVHRAALIAFMERGVHRTAARTGVLLFISEDEHRVEILADEGIHARVGVDGWKHHVDAVIASIHANKAAEGITAVVAALGKDLAAAVPGTASVNELPNDVVMQKRG